MKVLKLVVFSVLALASNVAYGDSWNVCLISINGAFHANVYGRTLEECEQRGRQVVREYCRAGEHYVQLDGQYTAGNPQYFSKGYKCIQSLRPAERNY